MDNLIERVIEHLDATRGEWELVERDWAVGEFRLRHKSSYSNCPVKHMDGALYTKLMSEDNGGGREELSAVLSAADGTRHQGAPIYDKTLRARMLEAAGLRESDGFRYQMGHYDS